MGCGAQIIYSFLIDPVENGQDSCPKSLKKFPSVCGVWQPPPPKKKVIQKKFQLLGHNLRTRHSTENLFQNKIFCTIFSTKKVFYVFSLNRMLRPLWNETSKVDTLTPHGMSSHWSQILYQWQDYGRVSDCQPPPPLPKKTFSNGTAKFFDYFYKIPFNIQHCFKIFFRFPRNFSKIYWRFTSVQNFLKLLFIFFIVFFHCILWFLNNF